MFQVDVSIKYNFYSSAGTMLGLLLRDQNVVSRQRRDSASGDKRKRVQRGKKDKKKEDSNESDGDNHDGDYDDGDYDSGKSRQKQRRGRMSQRQGNGCFRNYEFRVMTGNYREVKKVNQKQGNM